MVKFLSGPIGGRLLPLPLLKLSDMDGGAYGFGSSSASTSFLASRAVIKALISRQAGETVEDLIEYFQARFVPIVPNSAAHPSSV
jgi:SEL1 protein